MNWKYFRVTGFIYVVINHAELIGSKLVQNVILPTEKTIKAGVMM